MENLPACNIYFSSRKVEYLSHYFGKGLISEIISWFRLFRHWKLFFEFTSETRSQFFLCEFIADGPSMPIHCILEEKEVLPEDQNLIHSTKNISLHQLETEMEDHPFHGKEWDLGTYDCQKGILILLERLGLDKEEIFLPLTATEGLKMSICVGFLSLILKSSE